ncbi:MAG: 4a-hydroxytetrahydrobiopterin dehydratase [Chlamydiota bacterium]|nr:4a-hydroxytetrahydrobiopterin dehydratase [Chlamydiota bacterium]
MESQCNLTNKKCVPCHGGIPPLKGKELATLHKELGGNWEVVNEHHIHKEYSFDDFVGALDFVNKLGAIAEEEGHHPDVLLSYGKVIVTIWTHKIDGLSESDFILAAKCDQII